MKQRTLKLISMVLAAIMVALPLSACGGKGKSKSEKEIINLSFYIGEFGDEWINKLADEWSATNNKYEIKAVSHMNLAGPIIADIKSGTTTDIFIAEDCSFNTIFSPEYLEDLTDVLGKVAPGDTVTIGEKIANRDSWMKMASKDGATYTVPYNISPTGLIFDYDRFKANGWLFDKDGKLGGTNGVHPGRDGVEGTYDDGQPQNMTQFKAMCEKIRNTGTEVFLFMGARHSGYVNNVAYAYMAQLVGEENFEIFYSHDSQGKEVELADGTKTAFTIEEGYKSYQMNGVKEMAKFVSEYFTNRNYVSDATLNDMALTVDASHTQFLTKESAFIVEGNWWENGARQLIDGMSRYDSEAKAYGETDYRYMFVPVTGEGKNYINSQTGGSIIIPKENDPEKLAAIKDFLVFMLSDNNMSKVTRDTGMIWNYNYSISAENMAGMTKFTKNTYDMIQDTENVCIHSMYIDTAATPIHAYTSLGCSDYMFLNPSTQTQIVIALSQDANGNIQTFLNNITAYNTAERWAAWVAQAKSYGFYQ